MSFSSERDKSVGESKTVPIPPKLNPDKYGHKEKEGPRKLLLPVNLIRRKKIQRFE